MEKKSKEEKLQEKLEKKEEKKRLKDEKRKLKKEKKKQATNENKVTLKEKVSVNIRKKLLIDRTRTFLLIVILVLAYISLNLAISSIDLPELDISKGKRYTLSDASKKAIANIDQEVKIYAYGFEEDSQLIKFLKKYNNANEKITYEILTEESNYNKVKENELQEGYLVLIIESGESKKVIDATTEFSTYDYATYQQVDTTEQTITNAILSLLLENKPKVYFTEGHNEFSLSQHLALLDNYLKYESFETESINLATTNAVPEDCDVLAIMSPTADFFDNERDMVLNYISNGGKLYISMDPLQTNYPNLKVILEQYGVSVQDGIIYELSENQAIYSSPNIFKPQVSISHSITKDIYSDIYSNNGAIWLVNSARLKFESEETLEQLNVTKEDLLYSSENAMFLTDLSTTFEESLESAEEGKSVISSILTKKVTKTNESGESTEAESKLIICANGTYISDVHGVEELSSTYPLSYIENNKDFALNAMANLADKEGLTIRKEIYTSTYVPTNSQILIVAILIFAIPVVIILTGFVVWIYRKRRK